MAIWQLRVLGEATLRSVEKTLYPERKTAALLTYLALEGPTPRIKLSRLLWPDSGESAARGNLRQTLSRLKKNTNAELVNAGDRLSLQGLEVDAARLEVSAFATKVAEVSESGQLLDLYDYDDCPDFADWLFSKREHIQSARQQMLTSLLQREEQQANFTEALRYAQLLLALEPLAEETHRQMIRLHYLSGDRAAALKAFEKCKNFLRKELDVEPSGETLNLVSEIEFGELLPAPVQPKTMLPLRVLRPPFVGREQAWEMMEEAWQRRQLILVSGVAGIGKSRLIQEFLASKKVSCGWFGSRLGDAQIPYATLTRSLRQMVQDYAVTLDGWVKSELARVLPELGEAEAMTSEQDVLRFCDAQGEAMRLAMRAGMQAVVYEDVHYIDSGSIQAGLHIFPDHWNHEDGLNIIVSFRPDEIRDDEALMNKRLTDLVMTGSAVLVELEPFSDKALHDFVGHLGISDLEFWTEQLSTYTGGNPFFVIETIKHLIESEQLNKHQKKLSLPPSGKVFALLKERLMRLSPEAQRLSWTAAIARANFSSELASQVLGKTPFDLTEAFAELELSHIFVQNKFSHDLLAETTLSLVPAPIKSYIHSKCAEVLEETNTNPITLAEHYIQAGDEEKALPNLLEAAEQNFQLGLLSEAVRLLEQASEMKSSRRDEAATILAARYIMQNQSKKAEKIARACLESENVVARVTAHNVLSEVWSNQGRFKESLELTEKGLALAKLYKPEQIISFQQDASKIAYYLGDYPKAMKFLEEILESLSKQEEKADYLTIIMSMAVIYDDMGNKTKSQALEDEAYQLATELNSGMHLVQLTSNYLVDCLNDKQVELAIPRAEAALSLGEFFVSQRLRINLALAYEVAGDDAKALSLWEVLSNADNEAFRCVALAHLSLHDARQHKHEAAKQRFEEAFKIAKHNEMAPVLSAVVYAGLKINQPYARKKATALLSKLNLSLIQPFRRRQLETLLSETHLIPAKQ